MKIKCVSFKKPWKQTKQKQTAFTLPNMYKYKTNEYDQPFKHNKLIKDLKRLEKITVTNPKNKKQARTAITVTSP